MFLYKCNIFREDKMIGLNQLPVTSCYSQGFSVCIICTDCSYLSYSTSTTMVLHIEETLNDSLSLANAFKTGISFFLKIVYSYRNMTEIRLTYIYIYIYIIYSTFGWWNKTYYITIYVYIMNIYISVKSRPLLDQLIQY